MYCGTPTVRMCHQPRNDDRPRHKPLMFYLLLTCFLPRDSWLAKNILNENQAKEIEELDAGSMDELPHFM